MKKACIIILLLSISTACISDRSLVSDKLILGPVAENQGRSIFEENHGVLLTGKKARISWQSCIRRPGGSYFVMINPGPNEWGMGEACKHPAASELLKHGFNIFAISRPSQESLGDERTVSQLYAALKLVGTEDRPLEGLWAYGEGSVAAFRLARLLPLKILIVGNGIYDLEQSLKLTDDPDFVARVRAMPEFKEPSFVEQRSVAWDLNGLPRHIYLYHSGKNALVPVLQASQFKSSLAASEYRVGLKVAELESLEIEPAVHRSIMSGILVEIKQNQ